MSVTQSQSVHPASVSNVAVGRYITTGTAAAITITTGFKPRYVRVTNLAATGSDAEWFEGMADASAMKRVTAGDKTLITTLGITVSANGFVIGLDTDLNVTSEQLSWLAIG
jgi:hypothetical protein